MPSPFIIQRVLSLQLKNQEDSAGSFPGDLEGANTQIIIANQDSSFVNTKAEPLLTGMHQINQDGVDSSYQNNFYKLSGQGESRKQMFIGGGWLDSGSSLYDSAEAINATLFGNDSIRADLLQVNNFTGQSVDSAALETFVHTTHTSVHRGHFRSHTSGYIQDLDASQSISGNQMYWDASRTMTTIGGRSVPNTNTSYNLGYLRGSNQTWPQHFTIYAIYYPRGNDQDEWYEHLSNKHLVQIERTDNNGTMYVGANNNLQNTGLKVPHAQWSRIIITGSASSSTTGAQTTYEAYVNGVKGNTMSAQGVVGRHLSSTSGGYRFRYYYYSTGYFLELGVLNTALSASEVSTLDTMLNYQLTGQGGATTSQLTSRTIGYSGDSSFAEMPLLNNTSAGNPPPYKSFDTSNIHAKIRIASADTMKRNTVPALVKKIIIADSAASTFIDETPLEFDGDSALMKGRQNHLFQRITTLDENNDPRLDVVPSVDSGDGGGGVGPIQTWF